MIPCSWLTVGFGHGGTLTGVLREEGKWGYSIYSLGFSGCDLMTELLRCLNNVNSIVPGTGKLSAKLVLIF